jgi:hypothetical protein
MTVAVSILQPSLVQLATAVEIRIITLVTQYAVLMGSTIAQTYNFMLIFCEYSQAPTQFLVKMSVRNISWG